MGERRVFRPMREKGGWTNGIDSYIGRIYNHSYTFLTNTGHLSHFFYSTIYIVSFTDNNGKGQLIP